MTDMILYILMIAVICCCIIDVSGIIESIEDGLTKMLRMKTRAHVPKPLSCSLCMTHWSGLAFLLITGQFSLLSYMLVLLVAMLTPVITDTIFFIRGLLTKMIVVLGDWMRI